MGLWGLGSRDAKDWGLGIRVWDKVVGLRD